MKKFAHTKILIALLTLIALSGCGGSSGDFVVIGGGTATAVDDNYTTNQTNLVVDAANGVRVNDIHNGALVTGSDTVSTLGGTVAVNPDGGFTYTVPAGVMNQNDTFRYTLDGGSQATVTIAIGALITTQADAYNSLGQVVLNIAAAEGVLANDNNAGGLTVDTFSSPSTLGGTVNVNGDGSFTYTPAAGVSNQADTFTYTIGGQTETVTINLAGLVAFVDNSQAANGTGTQASPFNNLAAALAASAAGETVFVRTGTGDNTNQAGPLTIPTGVSLAGEGAALQTGAQVLLPAGGAPALDGPITLSDDTSFTGFNLQANNGGGAVFGTIANATISDNTLNNAGGPSVDLTISGTLTLQNNQVTQATLRGFDIEVRNADTLNATISGNSLDSVNDDVIRLQSHNTATAIFNLTDNTITNSAFTLIDCEAFDTSNQTVIGSGNVGTGGARGYEPFANNNNATQRFQLRNETFTGQTTAGLGTFNNGGCFDILNCTFDIVDFGSTVDVERLDGANGGPLDTVNTITTLVTGGAVARPIGFCGF